MIGFSKRIFLLVSIFLTAVCCAENSDVAQLSAADIEIQDLELLEKESVAELTAIQENAFLASPAALHGNHDVLPDQAPSTSFSISIISSASSSKNPSDPSITITIISSASMDKPTFRPTRSPTAAPPTYQPTRQVLPIVEFTSTLSLSNVYNPQLDAPAQTSLAQAVCGSLKLSTNDCSFVDFTLLSSVPPSPAPTISPQQQLHMEEVEEEHRNLLMLHRDRESSLEAEQLEELQTLQAQEPSQPQQHHSGDNTDIIRLEETTSKRPTMAPTVRVVYSMTARVQTSTIAPGSFASNPSAYFAQLTSTLSLAVSSGTFNNQLRAYSVSNGASSTYRSSCSAVTTSSDGIFMPQALDSASPAAVTPGAIAGIVIGVLIAVAIGIAVFAFYYKTYFSKQSYRYYQFDDTSTELGRGKHVNLQNNRGEDEDVSLFDDFVQSPKSQQQRQQEMVAVTKYHSNAPQHNYQNQGDDLDILDDEALVSISLHNKTTRF